MDAGALCTYVHAATYLHVAFLLYELYTILFPQEVHMADIPLNMVNQGENFLKNLTLQNYLLLPICNM